MASVSLRLPVLRRAEPPATRSSLDVGNTASGSLGVTAAMVSISIGYTSETSSSRSASDSFVIGPNQSGWIDWTSVYRTTPIYQRNGILGNTATAYSNRWTAPTDRWFPN
jgi:hypothetical protein